SNKHKCSEAGDNAKASIVLSTQPKSQLGHVLANFPSVKPSKSTTFSCYQTRGDAKVVEDSDDAKFVDLPTLIARETDSINFHLANQAAGCWYLIGVHDKKTGKTTIHSAPLHNLTHNVKALKGQEPIAVSVLQQLEARAALGELFGTKKAKLAIKAQEQNKVNESIQKSTQVMLSKQESQATADSTHLVPPYNVEATAPSKVYPLHNIIPETKWKMLSKAPFLISICDSSSPSTTNIKILQYIMYMMLFRQLAIQNNVGKVSLPEKLMSMLSIVADGLLSQFMSQKEMLLLTHMFALCLHVDDYAMNTEIVAKDLSHSTHINTLFKSMGCQITKLTPADLKRLGLPNNAAEMKHALLKVPFEFPKPCGKHRHG
ncbi:Rpa49 subunit specific to nuclear RNA polymerase I, partial [Pisolithus tinctorius]